MKIYSRLKSILSEMASVWQKKIESWYLNGRDIINTPQFQYQTKDQGYGSSRSYHQISKSKKSKVKSNEKVKI